MLMRRRRGEEGASSLELLVFFPLLMLIILVTVQVALSWYGNEVAMTTARQTVAPVLMIRPLSPRRSGREPTTRSRRGAEA